MSFQGKHDFGRFDFLSLGKYFALLSAVLVALVIVDIAVQGFNYGIDFVGGTEVQVLFEGEDVTTADVRAFTQELGHANANVQKIGDEGNEYLIRIESVVGKTDAETNQILNSTIKDFKAALETQFAAGSPVLRRVDTVGPQVGSELKKNAGLAIFYSLLLVLIYIGLRFDYKYAPGAVFCLFHDAIIVLGVFSVFGLEVNVQTLAAVLTVIGYSLNDTIVIFDRIRENEKLYRDKDFTWVCNHSINDTLSRTLLTTLTTLLAVGALYFIAGGVIEDFAFALGIGMIVGVYSTVYVATPLVVFLDSLQRGQKLKARAA